LADPALPVPLLALNRAGAATPSAAAGSIQFALAPEDEARQIARRAFAAGGRRALLLRPAGEWGDKMADSLVAAWEEAGGRLVASGSYGSRESYSQTVEEALDLDASAARARALRELLGTPLETAGRRRQDLDVVFMLAPGSEAAKSLKPLLAYHFAGDLPAYATSAANSAELRNGDRDLTGLRIVELPWLLGDGALQRSLAAAGDLRGGGLSRLQALGVDAYRLALRHGQLEPRGLLLIAGSTGYLHVNDRGEVVRELPLVEFASGGLRPL
jgi:outer membrane PBP1 activator LpoA protein